MYLCLSSKLDQQFRLLLLCLIKMRNGEIMKEQLRVREWGAGRGGRCRHGIVLSITACHPGVLGSNLANGYRFFPFSIEEIEYQAILLPERNSLRHEPILRSEQKRDQREPS